MVRQIFIFFSLAYLISWLIWLPLYAPSMGINFFEPLPYQHALGALGPLLASLVCTWRFNGWPGLKNLVARLYDSSTIFLMSVAFLGPFVLLFIAIVISYFTTWVFPDLSKIGLTKEFPHFNLLNFFFYNLLFFGFGEEVGWRGFALPRLQNRYNALVSSIILTLFWALWHWPLFLFRPGYLNMDLVAITGWFFSLLTGSVLLTWLFNSSKGSILICAVFHSAIDVAFTSDYLNPKLVNLTGMLITVSGLLIVFWFKPTNLSGNARVKLSIRDRN